MLGMHAQNKLKFLMNAYKRTISRIAYYPAFQTRRRSAYLKSSLFHLAQHSPDTYFDCRSSLVRAFVRATCCYFEKKRHAQVLLAIVFVSIIAFEVVFFSDYMNTLYKDFKGLKLLLVSFPVLLIHLATNYAFPFNLYAPMQPIYIEVTGNINHRNNSILIVGYPSSFLLYRSRVLALIAFYIFLSQLLADYSPLLSFMCILLASAASGTWFSGMFFILSDMYAMWRTQNIFPEYVLTNIQMAQLVLIGRYHSFRRELDVRLRLILMTRKAASIIERSLMLRLSAANGGTSVLALVLNGVGASLREEGFKLVMPKPDTFLDFQNYIASTVPIIITGQWHSLKQAEAPKYREHSFHNWFAFSRRITVTILPFAFLLILQNTSLALDAPQQSLATLVATFWFFISLLVSFDPQYRDKLSAMEAVAATLNPAAK